MIVRHAPLVEPKFVLGQKVQASPAMVERYSEWYGVEMYICGFSIKPYAPSSWSRATEVPPGHEPVVTYATTDYWPPRHLGDITDEWAEDDLCAVGADF